MTIFGAGRHRHDEQAMTLASLAVLVP